ncbi:RIO1 family regulatory kinase/ATPase [Actinosynnema sp. NPDC050801]|uniref:serine protein kinase RIO n=1 Tax=unclassified Actinosynnema TaxID=2637065 RepID=UPI0033D7029B
MKWRAKKAKKASARADGDIEPGRRGRLTEEAKDRLAQMREDAAAADVPEDGDRWSTWGDADQGPKPHPDWLVTDLSAVDRELGIVKTGKEADVFLLERAMPGTDRSCLLAAKRYRSNDHRLFHRDAGYLEGRRMRRSREMRAMANRSAFGRNLIAERWAVAEFAALTTLWQSGAPVPYPVQRDGTELLLEFVGTDGAAAPRLAQLRPEPDELLGLWRQLVDALSVMASVGLAHGDLSAFNLMVHDGRLVVIDLPQVVDLVANPRGPEFLERDVRNVAGWFTARGLPPELAEPHDTTEMLLDLAGLR